MDQFQVEVLHAPQHPSPDCADIVVAAAAPFCGFGPPSPSASQRPALVSWESYRDSSTTSLPMVSLSTSPAASAPAEQAPSACHEPHFNMDAYLAAWARLADEQGCSAQHASPEPHPAAEAWVQQQQQQPLPAAPAPVPAAHLAAAVPPAAREYCNPAAEHYRRRLGELPAPMRGSTPSSLWIDWTAVQPEDLLLGDLAY